MSCTLPVRRGGLLSVLALVACLLALPVPEAAAQGRVYNASELSTPPKVKSSTAAASAVERSLPAALRSVGGKVQLQFVVGTDGKVEPSSIEVLLASASALGEAASKAIQKVDFIPGMLDGKPVRAVVQFPIIYAAR